MDKRLKDRLDAIERAEADGQGSFLFLSHEGDDQFQDSHSNRMYSAERLHALHMARPDLVILNQGGAGSLPAPIHPAGNPLNRSLNDIRRYNEVLGKRHDGQQLAAEEEVYLVEWDAASARVQTEYEAWETASQDQYDETVRRVEVMNARSRAESGHDR